MKRDASEIDIIEKWRKGLNSDSPEEVKEALWKIGLNKEFSLKGNVKTIPEKWKGKDKKILEMTEVVLQILN